MRTIARREALRIAARPREEPVAEPEERTSELVIGREEGPSELRDQLRRLSKPERSALFLRYWADKSDSEIAAALEIPLGTAKIRMHRARQKLAAGLAAPVKGQR